MEERVGGQDSREVFDQQTSLELNFTGVDLSLKQDRQNSSPWECLAVFLLQW